MSVRLVSAICIRGHCYLNILLWLKPWIKPVSLSRGLDEVQFVLGVRCNFYQLLNENETEVKN